jgi:hypothetical protein
MYNLIKILVLNVLVKSSLKYVCVLIIETEVEVVFERNDAYLFAVLENNQNFQLLRCSIVEPVVKCCLHRAEFGL